jgi:GNAT superfamily N-acetyltransferase
MNGKNAISAADSEQIRLRRMEERDIDLAHTLSVAVGWPHRPGDWSVAFKVGHGICAHDGIGRLVGTAMWWPMGRAFATVGMVIVSPGQQGKGLGRRLMRAVLEALPGWTLQLNATAAGLRLYQSDRFRAIGAIEQYQGIALASGSEAPPGSAVRPFRDTDWAAICELDALACGVPREMILRTLIADAEGNVSEHDGRISGFAFCRSFGRGHVIGPVVAADEPMAIALTAPFVAAQAGRFLRVDIVEGATEFSRFLEGNGLLPSGGATTMIRGRRPPISQRARKIGLLSQAMG